MSGNLSQLIEKLNRIVYDKGDLDLLLALDRVMDNDTEADQMTALSAIVRQINEQRSANKGK